MGVDELEPSVHHRSVAGGAEDVSSGRRYTETTNWQMAKVGKKAVLKQNFGFLSMLGLAATVMGTWEGMVILFTTSFSNGGSLGSIIGLIIVWIGTLCSVATMAEMVSMIPTAGGQYHWVAVLAPKSCGKFLSYLTAWLTVINWQASVASSGFAIATIIQGMAYLGNNDYVATQWQIPLIYWAGILFAVFFNTIAGRALPQVESTVLVVHVLGFFATMIPLLVYGPKGDPSAVFGTWINEGGWSTQGLSFMVGLVGPAYAFSGADGAVHMCEEVDNAAVVVPRAMVWGVMLNGTMGFAMLLTILFVLGDADSVFDTDYAFPFIQIYQNAVGNLAGVMVMTFIILFIVVTSVITFIATTSRSTWAFSRDRGFPAWRTFSKIEPRTQLPIYAIGLTIVVSFILSLIAFGSTLAFNDVVSLTISASYATYIIGNTLLLWRRCAGHIKPYSSGNAELANTMGTDKLSWGPWKLWEPIGILANVIGVVFMIIIFVFSFFPIAIQPTSDTMNWSCFMFGVIMIAASLYYIIGRREYKGPVVEIDASGMEMDDVSMEKDIHNTR